MLAATASASYTYEVYEYDINSKTLNNSESILFDQQGGILTVNLRDGSSADVLGTSNLVEGSGGIWEAGLWDTSNFSMSGGEVHEIAIHNEATAFFSGGLIERIWSGQQAWKQEGDPPAPVWNPHITIECLDHSYNDDTNLLTGHWLDSTAFSILLIDVDNYSPAIENIQFVPEPTALTLLALGGLLIHRKKAIPLYRPPGEHRKEKS